MTDRRFSYAELVEMFGGQIPIEAVNILMGAPDDEPLSKVRERITDLAVGWNTRPLADRLEQREGWRGIESAPTDGRNVLVFCPRASDHGYNRIRLTWRKDGKWQGANNTSWPPTHWMPLPPAPETAP